MDASRDFLSTGYSSRTGTTLSTMTRAGGGLDSGSMPAPTPPAFSRLPDLSSPRRAIGTASSPHRLAAAAPPVAEEVPEVDLLSRAQPKLLAEEEEWVDDGAEEMIPDDDY